MAPRAMDIPIHEELGVILQLLHGSILQYQTLVIWARELDIQTTLIIDKLWSNKVTYWVVIIGT